MRAITSKLALGAIAQFSKASSSGLRTRSLTTSNTLASAFGARYVRVSGISGGNTFAVSELQLWSTSNQLVAVGKPAVGPLPYQIVDDRPAQNGTSSTDPNYSVVLTHETGSATALMVDLGKVVPTCGSRFESCGHEPALQTDNDDTYMFDYSIDGKDWTTYGTSTRTAPCTARSRVLGAAACRRAT